MNYLAAMAAAVVTRLETIPAIATVHSSRNPPSQDDDLPAAQVFIGQDAAEPDGNPRTGGALRFTHTSILVIEVLDQANDGETLKEQLHGHAEAVCQALLVDPAAWWGASGEGIAGFDQMFLAPPEGAAITGRVQVQIKVLWRSVWAGDATALPPLTTVSIGATGGVGVIISTGETP